MDVANHLELKGRLCAVKRLGSLHAASGALTWQILQEVEEMIHPWSTEWTEPQGTRHWKQVLRTHLPMPRSIRTLHPYDVRKTLWEVFAQPRLTPIPAWPSILHCDNPRTFEPRWGWKKKLSMETRVTQCWQFVAISARRWIWVSMCLTQRGWTQLDELDYLRGNACSYACTCQVLRCVETCRRGGLCLCVCVLPPSRCSWRCVRLCHNEIPKGTLS